jgi:hypothetical protein
MDEVAELDYAVPRPHRPWSVAAIVALILGVFSGPVDFALVRLSGIAYGISIVGGACVAIVGIPILLYCVWAYAWREGRVQGRALALVGFIATLLWSIGLIAFFYDIDAHLE